MDSDSDDSQDFSPPRTPTRTPPTPGRKLRSNAVAAPSALLNSPARRVYTPVAAQNYADVMLAGPRLPQSSTAAPAQTAASSSSCVFQQPQPRTNTAAARNPTEGVVARESTIQELRDMIEQAVTAYENEGDMCAKKRLRIIRFRIKTSVLLRLQVISDIGFAPGMDADIDKGFLRTELEGDQEDTVLEHYFRLLTRLVRKPATTRFGNQRQ